MQDSIILLQLRHCRRGEDDADAHLNLGVAYGRLGMHKEEI